MMLQNVSGRYLQVFMTLIAMLIFGLRIAVSSQLDNWYIPFYPVGELLDNIIWKLSKKAQSWNSSFNISVHPSNNKIECSAELHS